MTITWTRANGTVRIVVDVGAIGFLRWRLSVAKYERDDAGVNAIEQAIRSLES